MADLHNRLSRIRDLFEKAESAIKEFETLEFTILTPAINELRYAGFHLLKSVAKKALDEDQLGRAEKHCKRAIYDASEASMQHYLKKFAEFKKDYARVVVADVVPNYLSYLQEMQAAQKILNFGKITDEEVEERKLEFYKDCREKTKNLSEICDELEIAREELNKKIKAQNLKTMLTLLAIALPILVAIVIAFIK